MMSNTAKSSRARARAVGAVGDKFVF